VGAKVGVKKFDDLSEKIKNDVRAKSEEQYLAFVVLQHSGKQHNKLKMDLQNEFTTGNVKYPKLRQSPHHLIDRYLIDKYTKPAGVSPTNYEGSAFAQKVGRDGKGDTHLEPYSKTYWKVQYCHKCKKKGHPSKHCPNKDNHKSNDDKNCSIKSSNRSSKSKSSKK
jgi:hypothetical protein